MEISIFDLINPNFKISVDLSEELKNKIRSKIKHKISDLSKKLKLKTARLYEYFIWKNSAIPLEVLLKISNLLKISKDEIEQNIIMYKQLHVPGKNSIKNPKLPIKINPYFTSLIANLFFDGSVPNDGKGTYYNQKHKEIMENFIKKIKEIFGDVSYSLILDHKGVLKCRLPRLIGEICKCVYNVKSFGTFDSRIPEFMFKLNKKHKIAFILTSIIDEGSITYDGQIMFGVSNKLLCNDVRELCQELGLETTKVTQKSSSNYFYFYIKSQDKLLKIIESINKNYPLISLNYKEKRLRYYFEIKKYPGLRTQNGGNLRKKKILESLKKGKKSVNQLSMELLILPRSLRRHLNFLEKNSKIKKEKRGSEYFYSLIFH